MFDYEHELHITNAALFNHDHCNFQHYYKELKIRQWNRWKCTLSAKFLINYISMLTFFRESHLTAWGNIQTRLEPKVSTLLRYVFWGHLSGTTTPLISSEMFLEFSLRPLSPRLWGHSASATPEVAFYAQRTNLCRCIRCLINQLKSEMRNPLYQSSLTFLRSCGSWSKMIT